MSQINILLKLLNAAGVVIDPAEKLLHARDTNNEQTTPLLAGAIFEGAYTKIDDDAHVEILYAATTPFTFQKIWSSDGVTPLGGAFGTSATASRVVSGYNVVYDLLEGRNMAPYYKIKIINGVSDQTAYPGFIHLVWKISTPYTGSYGFLTDSLTNLSKALLTRSAAPQLPDTGNSAVRTSAQGTTEFVGTWYATRDAGVVRQLVVLVGLDAAGAVGNATLGGTFVFEYGDDGSTAIISETRTITSFTDLRDFDLLNAGRYFRVKFTPSRAMTGSEAVIVTTTQRTQNDGQFIRLPNQVLEEQNAAMGQTFAFLKAFNNSGLSENLRAVSLNETVAATLYALLTRSQLLAEDAVTPGSIQNIRARSPNDSVTSPGFGLEMLAYTMLFDPTGPPSNRWFRARGDTNFGMDVDVLRSVLPTGAATSANQLPNNHQVAVSNFPAAALEATQLLRNNAFATLLHFLPDTTAKEVRRDEAALDDYHGRAPDGTATSTASWEVVRFYKDALGKITRVRYRSGVAWDSRTAGWS